MSNLKNDSIVGDAVQRAAEDSEAADAAVRERIARFRGDDNAAMMGGWT
ncbi:hypothetical protein [Nocardia grenadensis]